MSSAKLAGMVGLIVSGLVACASDGAERTAGQAAALGDPPGNNGTVKIEEAGSTDDLPDNDPHVGCVLQIEFRGFDEGDLHASWTLSGQPPSGTAEIASGSVFIGEDPAGGAPDLDAVVVVDLATYDLSALTYDPMQGYHVKLEVDAEGAQGSGKKSKVFWAQGCGPTPDGGLPDSGTPDSGTPDGGRPDAGTPDSGTDAGRTW